MSHCGSREVHGGKQEREAQQVSFAANNSGKQLLTFLTYLCRPFFREESGKGLSLRKFNDYLRMVLEEKLPYSLVTAHSFRQGLATWMAEQGSTTEEIKAAGRWTSTAWEVYVRGPRITRVKLARRLAGGI